MPQALVDLFLLVGPFSLLIQITLCIHVYKTGRPYWWIWILFMGSLLGCAVYLLVEILPELRLRRPRLGNPSWLVPKSIRLARGREIVEESPTVQNRLALAALLAELGRADEAANVAAECASGVFKDDPEVIGEIVPHLLATARLAEAESLLAQANTHRNRTAKARLDLLRARLLLAQGDHAAAHAVLESLLPEALGEAPRYYLAVCLTRLGRRDDARALLTDITRKYRKGGAIWRRAEKEWFKAAKGSLRELETAVAG